MTILQNRAAFLRRLTTGGDFNESQATALADALDGDLEKPATEGQVATVRAELRGEIAALRVELKTEIAELRVELRTEIAELRSELKTEIAELRGELKSETAAIRADLATARAESKSDIASIKAEIADVRTYVERDFNRQLVIILAALGAMFAALKFT